jgi:hypothetical protein
MSITVCITPAKTLEYPEGGGHLWAYLNWALGLRGLGCKVIWLEGITRINSADAMRANVAALKLRLQHYGLPNCLALHSWTHEAPLDPTLLGCLNLDAAAEADLLLEFRYDTPVEVVKRFRRSAVVDLDPGLLQLWMSRGQVCLAPHDVYFTIGETVGESGSEFPNMGLRWLYSPPCVALDWWPPRKARANAAFTTIVHWYAGAWLGEEKAHFEDKRSGFLPFLDLPHYTGQSLELALDLAADDAERSILTNLGWHLVDARAVASTPWDYQNYIEESLAEFSCTKPAYVRLETAWVSDRTLCYLASGKPAVVQYTGISRFLPDSAGLFRFRDREEAGLSIKRIVNNYEEQCKLARTLAEDYFDARKVVKNVLERALA